MSIAQQYMSAAVPQFKMHTQNGSKIKPLREVQNIKRCQEKISQNTIACYISYRYEQEKANHDAGNQYYGEEAEAQLLASESFS